MLPSCGTTHKSHQESVFSSISERTQGSELYSRQGTDDTIEDTVNEQATRERPDKLWTPISDLPPPSPHHHCASEGQTPRGATASEEWDSIIAAERAAWSRGGADIPPSYSKATGLDSTGEVAGRSEVQQLRITTPDEKSGYQSCETLLSMSHQLTASELLRSR